MATATIAAVGGDYTTLTNWAAALPSTLTEPEIAEIDGWLGSIGSQTLAVTTTATNKLIIRAKAGQETDYSTASAKAGFENSTGFAEAFSLGAGCGHVDIEKIGVKLASNGNLFVNSSSTGLGASPQVTLTDCWYFGLESPFFLMQGGEIGRPISFTNCLGLNVRGHGLSTGLTPPQFTNCTHVFSVVFAANSGSAGFRYCVTNKCFGAHYGPTSGWGCFLNRKAGSGNDAATDATADLLDNLVLADQYVDPANDDWTLKPTAALKGGAGGVDIGFVMPSAGGGSTYTLTASAGSYALTGQSAGLAAARRLSGGAGSYTLSGQAAGLKAGRKLSAGAGAYALSGSAAGLKAARKLAAATGSYTLTGIDAVLDYTSTGPLTYTLTAEAGSYSLAGQAASLRATRTLTAGAGGYSLTGQAAGLAYGRRLAAGAGAYTLTGQVVALKATRVLAAEAGTYTLSGIAAGLDYSGFNPWTARAAAETAWSTQAAGEATWIGQAPSGGTWAVQ